jgi:hypothetical protein
MITLAALLLFTGFAGGYGVREIVSRRRRAAEKRGYLERKAAAAQIEVHPRPTIVRSPGPSVKMLPLSIRNALRTDDQRG